MDIVDFFGMIPDQVLERTAVIFVQGDLVFSGQPHQHRVVMQEYACVFAIFQLGLQPSTPDCAEMPRMGALSHAVEINETRTFDCFSMIDEAVFIHGMIRENGPEGCPVVVVANHQPHRNRQIGDGSLQRFIGCAFPPVGQISSNDDACGIGMIFHHMCQGARETGMGVQPTHFLARDCQVNV